MHIKISDKYKILNKFAECGSYHFKLETVGEDGELIPYKARKWEPELGKTMVKHWWQFLKRCPAVLEYTIKDLRELERKEWDDRPAVSKEDYDVFKF